MALDLRRYQIAMRCLEVAQAIALSNLGGPSTGDDEPKEAVQLPKNPPPDDHYVDPAIEDTLTAALNSVLSGPRRATIIDDLTPEDLEHVGDV